MVLLIYYTVISFILDAIIVLVCLAIEQMVPWVSLPIFLTLFFLNLWFAWVVAVRLTAPKLAPSS
jgi:hypothetical protein